MKRRSCVSKRDRQVGGGQAKCLIPALILASISTLESAGIHDSGSSTRSWMGILSDAPRQQNPPVSAGIFCLVRSTHPCPTMASCFMLEIGDASDREAEGDSGVDGGWKQGCTCAARTLRDSLAHAEHPVNLGDAQPVQDIRH